MSFNRVDYWRIVAGMMVVGLAVWVFVMNTDDTPPRAGRVPGSTARSQSEPKRLAQTDAGREGRLQERMRMVDLQIESRGIKDPNVLRAMRRVVRHAFVASRFQAEAYEDRPLPIEHGQTISQPYIVAFMTEALALDANDTVLEIGTGSGYQAAVCAEIAKEVYTIEIIEPLAQSATQRLASLDYNNVHVKAGDGFFGWPEHGPYDAIIGTAAAGRIPEPLLEQLKPLGRMILPKEDRLGRQYLVLITKQADGSIRKRDVLPVRFVPMTGEVERP